jgi:CRISPR-associated endonuclease/helicase Cas3
MLSDVDPPESWQRLFAGVQVGAPTRLHVGTPVQLRDEPKIYGLLVNPNGEADAGEPGRDASNKGPTGGKIMKFSAALPAAADADESPQRLEYWVDQWSENGDTTAATRAQLLDEHHGWASEAFSWIIDELHRQWRMDDELAQAMRGAIVVHDLGKDRKGWRRAAGAPLTGPPYAKTTGKGTRRFDGYRHEFGSLRDVCERELFDNLTGELKELGLHLVAAHHGRARPWIAAIDDKEILSDVLDEAALEAAMRYVRLQRIWGPWGLAWLEALVRAADAEASRRLDEEETSERQPEAAE